MVINDTKMRLLAIVYKCDIFRSMGKYIVGSYKLYTDIVSGACRRDSLVDCHSVQAPGMVAPSIGEEGGHLERANEL